MLSLKNRIEALGRLNFLEVVQRGRDRLALVECKRHPSAGKQLVRLDNALSGQGAGCCSVRLSAALSDHTLARRRIDPSMFEEETFSLAVIETHPDRSMLRVRVQGKIRGASLNIESRLKNIEKCLGGVTSKIERIQARHGSHLSLKVTKGAGKVNYSATCKITKEELAGFDKIIDATARGSEEGRARLAKRQAPGLDVFLRRASHPHVRVRRIMHELTGLAAHEEQPFLGLVGEARHLRLDLFYPDLGRKGLVIEVQSEIHERSIATFGGDEAFAKRLRHDEIKRKHFLNNAGLPQLILVRGDQREKPIRDALMACKPIRDAANPER